jgi:osmotically-inducible protein OsmY
MSKIHELPWTGSIFDVIVDRGIVNLWGVVRTEEEKNALRLVAEGTPGVRAVKDHLRIFSA